MDEYDQALLTRDGVMLERQVLQMHQRGDIDDVATKLAIYNLQRGTWVALSRRSQRHIVTREGQPHIYYVIPGSSPHQYYKVHPYVQSKLACDCASHQRQLITYSIMGKEVTVFACKHVIAALLLEAYHARAQREDSSDPDVTASELMGGT